MRNYIKNIRNNLNKKYFRNADDSFLRDERLKSSVAWMNKKTDIPPDVLLDNKLSDFNWPVFKNTKFDQGL